LNNNYKKNNAWLHITHKNSWKIIKKTMQGCTYEKFYKKINIKKNNLYKIKKKTIDEAYQPF
jgi:hypothetical protein